jgi:hypothetical protein
MERPCLSPGDRRGIVRAAYDKAARPVIFPPPLHIQVGLGLVPLERRVAGLACEMTDRKRVLYPACACPRQQGCCILHGVAHAIAPRYATEADTWLLTGELAYPTTFAVEVTPVEAMVLQRHAPAWLLTAQLEYARLTRRVA